MILDVAFVKSLSLCADFSKFQRPGSDCLPLPSGIAGGSSVSDSRKLPAAPAPRSSKDDAAPAVATDSSRLAAFLASTSLEPKPRALQPPAQAAPSSSPAAIATRIPARDHGHHQHYSDFSDPASPSAAGSVNGGGEVLLQWGHNKRSSGRRNATSASGSSPQRRAGVKIQRHSPGPAPAPPSRPSVAAPPKLIRLKCANPHQNDN
ncbi:uncharacterized protein LOC120688644 [Panicum virgatum]|uniref:uncharacterized protein LOC120688644 n=1 Tax=Panicum virgatum TaxID=38727 RepID=UPI0019D5E678|nr:uncharacterized protein LOC120688644 [Panicum virgatum]